jgi:hypothetical protein
MCLEDKKEQIQKTVQQVSQELDADIFVFTCDIHYLSATKFIEKINYFSDRKSNIALILTTWGGNPHATFKIASFLKRKYNKLILFIFGICKSSGTLLAIAADEIVMSDLGELGPLDIQVRKEGDIMYESGLNIKQSLDVIGQQAADIFNQCLDSIINDNGYSIPLKTAEEIAQSIAISLLAPVSGQIIPLRLGELDRLTQVAEKYADRLNPAKKKLVKYLVSEYPSHEFVIDYEEVRKIFRDRDFCQESTVVREPNEAEKSLESFLHNYVQFPSEFLGTLEEFVERIVESESNRNSDNSIQ